LDLDNRSPEQLLAQAQLERAKRGEPPGPAVVGFDPSILVNPEVAKIIKELAAMKGRWQIFNIDFDYTTTPEIIGPREDTNNVPVHME
jgi:hypothetical protein